MKKRYKFIIHGRLDGLNDYINSCRGSRYGGASMKKKNDETVKWAILQSFSNEKVEIAHPVVIKCRWYEKDKRRDPDNISFAKKFILDALVSMGILKDDSQKWIKGFVDDFDVDRKSPRVEVELIESIKEEE